MHNSHRRLMHFGQIKKKRISRIKDSSTHLSPINPGDEPWKVWQTAIRKKLLHLHRAPACFFVALYLGTCHNTR